MMGNYDSRRLDDEGASAHSSGRRGRRSPSGGIDYYDRGQRRSRSPAHKKRRSDDPGSRRAHRTRDDDERRQPAQHRLTHKHREESQRSRAPAKPAQELPFGARHLSKSDFPAFEALFAHFLDIQKQRDIRDMDDREVRGRWKSFLGKWNRGELAEGWYDPEMFTQVASRSPKPLRREPSQDVSPQQRPEDSDKSPRRDENSDDDGYGPTLPGFSQGKISGPGIPTIEDLSLRAEMAAESREESREALRLGRRADRAEQKERLEELVPRAEPGTRERRLEKKQQVNDKMREFRENSPGVGEVPGGERELMGGGDSLEEYKQMKEREKRRKTDREIRREEVERAKREEMEKRREAWQEREEGTVSMLRELAKQRFG